MMRSAHFSKFSLALCMLCPCACTEDGTLEQGILAALAGGDADGVDTTPLSEVIRTGDGETSGERPSGQERAAPVAGVVRARVVNESAKSVVISLEFLLEGRVVHETLLRIRPQRTSLTIGAELADTVIFREDPFDTDQRLREEIRKFEVDFLSGETIEFIIPASMEQEDSSNGLDDRQDDNADEPAEEEPEQDENDVAEEDEDVEEEDQEEQEDPSGDGGGGGGNGGGGGGGNGGCIAPSILEGLEGLSVCEGGVAVFRVVADGTGPLSYRWRFNGQELEGQVDPELIIDLVRQSHAGDYNVVVSNACGEMASAPATLTVSVPGLGDLDLNCGVDLDDFTLFQECFTGPDEPFSEGCAAADLDDDGDVDFLDFGTLQVVFTGP